MTGVEDGQSSAGERKELEAGGVSQEGRGSSKATGQQDLEAAAPGTGALSTQAKTRRGAAHGPFFWD